MFLQNLNFSKLAIMRPSFLLGKLKKIRPIKAETVAKGMIKALNSENNQKIFESDQIEKLVLN